MTINLNLILAALVAAVGLAVVSFIIAQLLKRRPARLNREQFQSRWRNLQKHCAQEATWPMAVIDADKLLDDALRRCHYRGKTMGERLVSAQRDLSSNDTVWYSHKLRNKIVHEDIQLKKRDVQAALKGYLQALRDLGAM
jgi:cell division protein FtsL